MIGCRWLLTTGGATRLAAATTITDDDDDVVDNGGDEEDDGGDGGDGGEGDLDELTFLPALAAGERFHLPPANPSPVGGELTGDVGSKIPSKLSSSFPTTTGATGEGPPLIRGDAPTPREGFSCSPELLVSPPPLQPSRRSKFSFDIRPESSLQSLSWYVSLVTLPTATMVVNGGGGAAGGRSCGCGCCWLTPAMMTIFGGVTGRPSSVVISGTAAGDDTIGCSSVSVTLGFSSPLSLPPAPPMPDDADEDTFVVAVDASDKKLVSEADLDGGLKRTGGGIALAKDFDECKLLFCFTRAGDLRGGGATVRADGLGHDLPPPGPLLAARSDAVPRGMLPEEDRFNLAPPTVLLPSVVVVADDAGGVLPAAKRLLLSTVASNRLLLLLLASVVAARPITLVTAALVAFFSPAPPDEVVVFAGFCCCF
uniref:Putative secreted protein n=1 Tax=Anopheles darlingi TaxID=43151 RepID=A0A2M4D8N1_ANODA